MISSQNEYSYKHYIILCLHLLAFFLFFTTFAHPIIITPINIYFNRIQVSIRRRYEKAQ